MDDRHFSTLIQALYAGATEPEGWANISQEIAVRFAAESCTVHTQSADGKVDLLSLTSNLHNKAMLEYQDHYYKDDVWVSGGASLGFPGAYLGQEIVSDVIFSRSEFCNDFCRQVGIFHLVGGGSQVDSMETVIIGIHRAEHRPQFEMEDKRAVALLIPHIRQAIEIRKRLAGAFRERSIALEALDAAAIGILILSEASRIRFANRRAESFLWAGQGITVSNGHVRITDTNQRARFDHAVKAAARTLTGDVTEPSSAFALPRNDVRPLHALVSPLPPSGFGTEFVEPGALVFLGDTEITNPTSVELLGRLHGLTRAEKRLLEALVNGERIADYAERCGISINTANTQLKSIFGKTGFNRTIDVVRHVLSDRIAWLSQGRL